MGRVKGIPKVNGLLKERYSTFKTEGYSAVQATESKVEKHLTSLGIKHKYVDVSSGIIPELSIVNMKSGTWKGSYCHAVVFIRENGGLITYYAPNNRVTAIVDAKWFKSNMDGTCLVLEQ